MSDDPPPTHPVFRDEGVSIGWGASVASDHPAPVEWGKTIRLGEAADRVGLTVHDQIALGDAELRKWMTRRVVWTFVGTNVATLLAFAGLVLLDQHDLASGLAPGDRIITSQVFMALLGATTVQVGAIAITIAGYLFPRRAGGGTP
jgi:hypothetical protein